MPKTVQACAFDTNLFGLQVGRVDLEAGNVDTEPSLQDLLGQAHSSGYRLIYVIGPQFNPQLGAPLVSVGIPGLLADWKTTLKLNLCDIDSGEICRHAFQRKGVRIHRYNGLQSPSTALLKLAVTSGEFSRFNVDSKLPASACQQIFESWLRNSIAKEVADETFVAIDDTNGSSTEAGFVTVKRQNNNVNIGLLAVGSEYRRQGLASALLSRAALWALEELGGEEFATMNVITQGSNAPAIACYERFGFRRVSVQEVHHVWLPDDLETPTRADSGLIPFCKQHFTGKESQYLNQLLATGLDSASLYTLMCASKVKTMLGDSSSRVLMTPSGTAALEMAALLCDLDPGHEVIMPSYTFSSTANAFVLRGAVPVFVDVRTDTLNIDETLIEQAITEKTRAICVVHYAGVPCEMDTICALCAKYGLKLIEDAAQGYLSVYKGRPIGSIGDFGCFSFHYTKNLIAGEGGALSVNNNKALADRAIVMWEKGTNRYDFIMGKVDKYRWIDVGSSFVPSELCSAVLWAQLEEAELITERRRELFRLYANSLQPLERLGFFTICHVPEHTQSNGHIFFLVFRDETLKNFFSAGLKQAGIVAFSHYWPLHLSPAGERYGRVSSAMTVTEHAHNSLLRLPMWSDLSFQQVQLIVDTIATLCSTASNA